MSTIDPRLYDGIPDAPELPSGSIGSSVWRDAAEQLGVTNLPPKSTDPNRPRNVPTGNQATFLSLAERARKRPLIQEFSIPELADEDGPFIARVKRPGLIALMKSGTIPPRIRTIINTVILSGETDSSSRFEKMVEDDTAEALGTVFELADYLCVIGFVEPKLVLTEDEENRDPVNLMWIERLPESARMRYYQQVMGDQSAMAEGVAPFPGQPDGVVPVGDDRDDVRGATVDDSVGSAT